MILINIANMMIWILIDIKEKIKFKMDKYWGKFECMNILLIVVVVTTLFSLYKVLCWGKMISQDVFDILKSYIITTLILSLKFLIKFEDDNSVRLNLVICYNLSGRSVWEISKIL